MKIRILSVGTKMPAWISHGYEEYAKRLTGSVKLELVEIPPGKRSKNSDLNKICQQEGKALLEAARPGNRLVTLEIKGKSHTTETLASRMEQWQMDGRDISMLVGGPEGLSQECLERSEERISLSALTLPHPLVRVILAEQIYRCWSLLEGHPYHR